MELELTSRTAVMPRNIEHWLSKHAVLLRALRHVDRDRPRADSTTGLLGGDVLAAALAQAAALPRGLMLGLAYPPYPPTHRPAQPPVQAHTSRKLDPL